jgi:hypothetical protein
MGAVRAPSYGHSRNKMMENPEQAPSVSRKYIWAGSKSTVPSDVSLYFGEGDIN